MTSDIHSETRMRHRWYQIRLSTILILVAICAWAMAYWPFSKRLDAVVAMIHDITKDRVGADGLYDPRLPGPEPLSGYGGLDKHHWFWRFKLAVEKLVLPELALAAFLTWKLGWWLAARWKPNVAPRTRYVVERATLIVVGSMIAAVIVVVTVWIIDEIFDPVFR